MELCAAWLAVALNFAYKWYPAILSVTLIAGRGRCDWSSGVFGAPPLPVVHGATLPLHMSDSANQASFTENIICHTFLFAICCTITAIICGQAQQRPSSATPHDLRPRQSQRMGGAPVEITHSPDVELSRGIIVQVWGLNAGLAVVLSMLIDKKGEEEKKRRLVDWHCERITNQSRKQHQPASPAACRPWRTAAH